MFSLELSYQNIRSSFAVAGLESNVANLTRQFVERAKNQANYHDYVFDHANDDHDHGGCNV